MNLDLLYRNIKPLDLAAVPIASDAERDYFRFYAIDFEDRYEGVSHYFGRIASGKYDIVSHYFKKEGAKETCFILHGYYDHVGLFKHLINYCLERNMSVVVFDLPGHGLSSGAKAVISSFDDYVQAFKDIIKFYSPAIDNVCYAIAQSTGAAVLMDYLLDTPKNNFSKMVLLAPLIRPVKWKYSIWIYNFAKYFLNQLPRNFSENSHDEGFKDFLRNKDPLQASILSVQWIGALKDWLVRFYAFKPSEQGPLIIQGEEDRTVEWPYNLKKIAEKFPNSNCFRIKNARHHLACESDEIRNKVFAAMDIYFGRGK
jgi:alpha-beta hydrolase superfamily lysophospholipase